MTGDDDPFPSPSPDLASLGERGLIARLRAAAASADPGVIRGIGDDAAVVTAGPKMVLSTDLLVEKVHFLRPRHPPRLLGRKALAVNLSDLAAMGAIPQFALLGIGAPPHFPTGEMEEILAGFLEGGREFGVSLIGGDVVRAEQLVLAVTVIGRVEPPGPVYRSGARPGELIFVSGVLGDAALGGLRLRQLPLPLTEAALAADPLAGPLRQHLDPTPRIAAGAKLAPLATAMIDLSDGLISDLSRLLEESHLPGAIIDLPALPLSPAFRRHFQVKNLPEKEALQAAIAGGEDYELLFTLRPPDHPRLAALSTELGLPFTCIGVLSSEPGIILRDENRNPVSLPPPLFEHFLGGEKA